MVEGYYISAEASDMDLEVIHSFLCRSYWAKGIPKELVRKSMQNSLCFGVFTSSKAQVGFARVVTDSSVIGYLGDVFVLEPHRKRGLGKWLMETVMSHPDLQGLRRILLATLDAHALYEKFGFVPLRAPERFMEKWVSDIYRKA